MSALIMVWVSGMTLAAIGLSSFISIMDEHWATKLGLLPVAAAAAATWPLLLLSVGIFWLERRIAQ